MANLEPATQRLADLVRGVTDDQLTKPTPCADWTVGDLLDHIGGFVVAFTAAAKKDMGDVTAQAPSADVSRLVGDWRTRFPRDLAALSDAWEDPSASTGMTRAGGVELPGEVAALVVMDELVVHGWDLARATGQPYESDTGSLEAALAFVEQFSAPGQEAQRAGLFGPVVSVPDTVPPLHRLVALAGRDPNWSA